ncbi:MAG: hypothetical protein V3V75_09675 [Thermoguttaceae bacterium]
MPTCLLLGCLFIGCAARSESAEFSELAAVRQGRAKQEPRRSLGDLLKQPVDSAARMIPNAPRLKVDQAAAAAAGIRKLAGKHLTLYTDMPSSAEIDQLPAIFDRAFGQWCEYFKINPAEHADWYVTGFLMKDKALFKRTGLLPPDLPQFAHGYSRNWELWLNDQSSDYYRRHLLLHEGTHAFMNTMLGACGPPWYMEAMAELLSTHRWAEGRLTLNYMPANREEVPLLGRIRLIKDAVAERRALHLKKVVEFSPYAFVENESYAWCWAAGTLLDHHPRYRQRFRQLYGNVLKPDFNQRFHKLFADDWEKMAEEWQILITGFEYGHDVASTAVDFTPGKALPAGGTTVVVDAKRGWQNSGLRLAADNKYELIAAGRYQLADKPRIWWSEPGGVSIRYYQGRPLGILLAAVHPDRSTEGLSPLLRPLAVGLGTTLRPKQTGTLYLKINDSAGELGDNAGQLKVEVKPL